MCEMKKILVLLVVVLGLNITSGKAQEGRFYIGTAGLTFASFSGDDVKLMTGVMIDDKTSWGLAPEFGYYIKDNFSFGLGIGYTKISKKGYEDIKMFGVYPYVRYFPYTTDKLRVFIEGGVEYLSIEDGVNEMTVGSSPGLSYLFSDNFSISVSYGFLGYQKIKNKDGAFIMGLDANNLKFSLNYTF